jgi:hypothetical protein
VLVTLHPFDTTLSHLRLWDVSAVKEEGAKVVVLSE